MANVLVQDGAGVAKYLKATGDGSNGDPFVVQHLMGSGATDDAAVAGELYPIAGVYQATVDEIDAGDIGRARMSRRRALLAARDHSFLELTSASPIPAGSDIVGLSTVALVSGDFSIRDTNYHFFYIPLAERGWSRAAIVVRAVSPFDQVATLRWIAGVAGSYTQGYGVLGEVSLPASTLAAAFLPGGGLGSGLGEVVGASSIVSSAVYALPALGDSGMSGIWLRVSFSVAPTTGALTLRISRQG